MSVPGTWYPRELKALPWQTPGVAAALGSLLPSSLGSSLSPCFPRGDHERVALEKSRGSSQILPKGLAPPLSGVIEFPPYRLDQRAGRLWRDDRPVELRPKAWTLLRYLAERPGALVTKEEMHAAVWGDVVVSDDTLTQTLGELRRALGDDPRAPRVIETVHRRGVRFIARVHGTPPGDGGLALAVTLQPAPGAGSPATLVGRETELATLRAFFRNASAGARQVVFMQGEPGIGKTSIVEAFVDALRASADGVLIGYGQCVEQRGEREPYMPVLEALERLSQGPARDRLLSTLRAVAPSWLARMPSLHSPADAGRPGRGDTDTTPHRMLREFASLVEAVSVDRPLVLVLEDLHWSDQGTVDLVSVLAQRPERARVMLLGTYRPAEATVLDHPFAQVVATLRTHHQCREIALEYLSRSHVTAYLQGGLPCHRRAGQAGSPGAVRRRRVRYNECADPVPSRAGRSRGWRR